MRNRLEELDRIAVDLANLSTPGYKTERRGNASSSRSAFEGALESAVDVTGGPVKIDFRQGTIATTGRGLDAAIDGPGFFVIDGPSGPRYTRNGSFTRSIDGTLVTFDGLPVQGESGPIRLGRGPVVITGDGTVKVNDVPAGKLAVVDLPEADAVRESGARFMARPGATPEPVAGPRVVGGSLENANVSLVDSLAHLTEVSRGFDSMQRGMSAVFNEMDDRAISELGRR
ncbi:MAG: flagellar hook-basal body protein [Vicinamibacterales bacterium]